MKVGEYHFRVYSQRFPSFSWEGRDILEVARARKKGREKREK